jgi:cobalt-zinc-cadmium efflux system outer membrane protein
MQHPELQYFSYDVRANDARILQASFRPNPVIDIETENIDAPLFMQTTFLLSQLIETGGKQQARVQLAKSIKDRNYLDYEVKKRQVFVETTLLFLQVLIDQQKIAFLEENLKSLHEYSSVVDKRVQAGKASIIEQANFQVLLSNAAMDLKTMQNEWRNSKLKLSAMWGKDNTDYTSFGNIDQMLPVANFEHMKNLLQNHPEILRFEVEKHVRSAKIALEKSLSYPDMNVRGGPRYLNEAKKWVWVVGFSVPLPINNRNQGGISESQEILERAERERQAVQIRLLTELNVAYSKLETLLVEIKILKDSVLPLTKKAFDLSYNGYMQAKYSYLELIETERAYRTSQIRYAEALGDYHKNLAIIDGLTGANATFNYPCE